MPHVTIIPKANQVYVDGVVEQVDCTAAPAGINAVQYDVDLGQGWIEWVHDGFGEFRANSLLDAKGYSAMFKPLQDAWTTAKQAPPTPSPPPAPKTVSRMQAMVALSQAGLLTAVQNWVATQSAIDQLIWQNATEFSRDSALLSAATSALNLTSQQVDQLFATAATIKP